jgi:uncharacterized membrane protein
MRLHEDPPQLRRGLTRLPGPFAACVMATVLLASATPAHSASPAVPGAAPATPPPVTASFTHSGLKTITYEIGNTLNNFGFLTAGAGALSGGLVLTAFNTLQSWTVYTVNDYFWSKYYPPEPSKDATGAFDINQSVWRTTLKYMTGKPVVASIKIAAIYVYTRSAATAFGYGLAATAGASVVFFLNNLAWDYYDQTVAVRNAASAPRKLNISDGNLARQQ